MESLLYANLGRSVSLKPLHNRLKKYSPFFVHLVECNHSLPQFFLDSCSIIHIKQRGVSFFTQPRSVFLEVYKSEIFDLIGAVVRFDGRTSLHICCYLTPNPGRHDNLQIYTHGECVRKALDEIFQIHSRFTAKYIPDDTYVTGDLNINLAAVTGWSSEIRIWFQERRFISCLPGFTHVQQGGHSKIDICFVHSSARFGFHKVTSVESRGGHAGAYVYPVRFTDMVRMEVFDSDGYIRYFERNPVILPCLSAEEKVGLFYSILGRQTSIFTKVQYVPGTPGSKYGSAVVAEFEEVMNWKREDVKSLMQKFNCHLSGRKNFFDFTRCFLLGDSRVDARSASSEKVRGFCLRQTEKNSMVRVATEPSFVYPDPFDPWRCEEQSDFYYRSRLRLSGEGVKQIVETLTDSSALQYQIALSNKIVKKCEGLHNAIASIINSIVEECHYPGLLKISRVTPVPNGVFFVSS